MVRARLGASDAKTATRAIIRALSKIVRDSDVVAKATEQEFYVLLPETDFFGAAMFVRRALAAARDEPEVAEVEARGCRSGLSPARRPSRKDGEDFDELVHRCRRGMDERRTSLQRKLMLDSLLVLGRGRAAPRHRPSRRSCPSTSAASRRAAGRSRTVLFDELQTEIGREVLREPSARGLLYVGGPEIRADLPIADALESPPPDLASRVYLLGRRANLESHPALTPVFLEGDERMTRHEFLLWLSENSAYALIQRRGRGATWGFHTSDAAVVDGLITKLQAEYDLQPY